MADFAPPDLPDIIEEQFYQWVVNSDWFRAAVAARGANSVEEKAKIAREIFFSDTQDFRSAFLAGLEPAFDGNRFNLPELAVFRHGVERRLQASTPGFDEKFQDIFGIHPSFLGSTPESVVAESARMGLFDTNILSALPREISDVAFEFLSDNAELVGGTARDVFDTDFSEAAPGTNFINLGNGQILEIPSLDEFTKGIESFTGGSFSDLAGLARNVGADFGGAFKGARSLFAGSPVPDSNFSSFGNIANVTNFARNLSRGDFTSAGGNLARFITGGPGGIFDLIFNSEPFTPGIDRSISGPFGAFDFEGNPAGRVDAEGNLTGLGGTLQDPFGTPQTSFDPRVATNDFTGAFGLGTVGNTGISVTPAMFDSTGLQRGGRFGYGFGFKTDGTFGSLTARDAGDTRGIAEQQAREDAAGIESGAGIGFSPSFSFSEADFGGTGIDTGAAPAGVDDFSADDFDDFDAGFDDFDFDF